MKKLLILGALTGMTLSANAVMDLQFVKRWNISGPSTADFDRIVAKPGGGFAAVGRINQQSDLFVMTLDHNANVIGSRPWDSPQRYDDVIVDLEVDSAGDIYILANGQGQLSASPIYLVKFDGATLATEWEIPIVGAGNFYSYKMCRTGTGAGESIFLAASVSADCKMYRYNLSGTLLGSTTFPHTAEVMDIVPMPSSAQGGAAICGAFGGKGFIGHVNSAGTLLVDIQFPTTSSQVSGLAISPTGTIVGAGGPFAGPLTIYRQSSGSTFNTYTRAGYGMGQGVAHHGGSTFVVSAHDGTAFAVSTWDSGSAAFGASHAANGRYGRFVRSADGSMYGVGPLFAFGFFNPLGPASSPVGVSVEDAAPFGQNDLLGIADGGTLYSPVSGTISSGITVSGYIKREVLDAIPDGQGGVIQVVSPNSGPGHLQRVNAAGTLVWNRVLDVKGMSSEAWSQIETFSNGDYCVVGRGVGGFSLARVTPSGVVSFVKRVAMPGYAAMIVQDAWVDTQNRVWVGGATYLNASYVSAIARVAADGTGLQVMTGVAGSAGWFSLQGQPSGSLLTLTGAAPVLAIRLDSMGVQLGSATASDGTQASLDVNAAGASVTAGVIGGVLSVTVRDAVFAHQWTQTISSASAPIVKFGPSGEVRVAYYTGSGFNLRAYSSTGTILWTSALPPTVELTYDLDVDLANGWAYVTCGENVASVSDGSVNVVRYLANGVRSAQRKTAGHANLGLQSGASFWALGDVTTRYKAREASSTKWSLP